MSDPYELAHSLAKAVHPFNHLVAAATDQAYLIGRLQDEVKQLREQRDEIIKERDEARRMWCEAEAVGNRLSVDDMKRRARTEAKRREWDCFKKEETP